MIVSWTRTLRNRFSKAGSRSGADTICSTVIIKLEFEFSIQNKFCWRVRRDKRENDSKGFETLLEPLVVEIIRGKQFQHNCPFAHGQHGSWTRVTRLATVLVFKTGVTRLATVLPKYWHVGFRAPFADHLTVFHGRHQRAQGIMMRKNEAQYHFALSQIVQVVIDFFPAILV